MIIIYAVKITEIRCAIMIIVLCKNFILFVFICTRRFSRRNRWQCRCVWCVRKGRRRGRGRGSVCSVKIDIFKICEISGFVFCSIWIFVFRIRMWVCSELCAFVRGKRRRDSGQQRRWNMVLDISKSSVLPKCYPIKKKSKIELNEFINVRCNILIWKL